MFHLSSRNMGLILLEKSWTLYTCTSLYVVSHTKILCKHMFNLLIFFFLLEAGLMTAKCQTQRHAAKVRRLKLFFFTFNKMSPNLYFLFSWRAGLINPNMAVMESDNLHAAEEKVKIIEYYCIGASLSASCRAMSLL